jgi:hypothetical protein
MDADVVRQLIRRRLEDGRLSHRHIADVQAQLGGGQPCDGCGAVITTKQTAVSGLAAEDWSPLEFHPECFEIWDVERNQPNRYPV